MQLLGFAVEPGELGCHLPPLEQLNWLRNTPKLENNGRRWWHFSGGVYVLRAIKRMHGMRLITPNWKKKPVRAKALRPVAQKEGHGR